MTFSLHCDADSAGERTIGFSTLHCPLWDSQRVCGKAQTHVLGLPTRAEKEESHTRQIFAHAHAGDEGQFFRFCWRCGFCTAQRVTGLAGRCRGVVQSLWSTPEAPEWQEPKRRTLAGGANAVGQVDVVQAAATEVGWDWCDVVHELECDGLGVDRFQARDESHGSQ